MKLKYCLWDSLRYDEVNPQNHVTTVGSWNLAPFVTVGQLSQCSRRCFSSKTSQLWHFFSTTRFFAGTRRGLVYISRKFRWFFGRAWYFHPQKILRHRGITQKIPNEYWVGFLPLIFWYFFSYHFFFITFKMVQQKSGCWISREHSTGDFQIRKMIIFFEQSSKAPELYRKKTRVEPKFCETINSCLNWFPQ